jgi:hypothetical protein
MALDQQTKNTLYSKSPVSISRIKVDSLQVLLHMVLFCGSQTPWSANDFAVLKYQYNFLTDNNSMHPKLVSGSTPGKCSSTKLNGMAFDLFKILFN